MKSITECAAGVKGSACLIRSFLRLIGVALVTLVGASFAAAQAYRVTPIESGVIPPDSVTPTHVTPDGTVVGFFRQGGTARGFAWRPDATPEVPGGFTDLGAIPGQATPVHGVTPTIWAWTNPKSTLAGPVPHQSHEVPMSGAIWWVGGPIERLPPLVANGSSGAVATTPGGVVVGWASDGRVGSDGVEAVQAAVWYAPPPTGPIGAALPLGTLPGFVNSEARAVNTYGTVVGICFNTIPWDGAPFPATQVMTAEQTAFITVGGQMSALDAHVITPGWSVVDVISIQDDGVITAIALGIDGLRHPVVLSPLGADLNDNGGLDGDDLPIFFGAVTGGDPIADLNNDGIVDIDDSSEFLSRLASGLPLGTPGISQADGPIPSNLFLWYFVADLAPASPNAPPTDPNGGIATLLAIRLISVPVGDDEIPPELTPSQLWNKENPGKYHKKHNPLCYGCHGWVEGNPTNNGMPGFPGDDPNNPYAPNGGTGGNGVSGGDGGPGGNAAPGSNGKGGSGGNGGLGTPDSPGGRGGNGGRGEGTGEGGPGGKGGNGDFGMPPHLRGTEGGNGGNGGAGGNDGGAGGKGGPGGDAPGSGTDGGSGGPGGPGGSPNGTGGEGGAGGDAGAGLVPANPGVGGNGGAGGGGGNGGAPDGKGGQGGRGGNGASGRWYGGNGGHGGYGGNEGRPNRGAGGNGGDAGRGDTSDDAGRPGHGGSGTPPGQPGGFIPPR